MYTQQEIIENISTRLDGYPINSFDKDGNLLILGEKVKVIFNNTDENKHIPGLILYDYTNKKYMVMLLNSTFKFINNSNIYYLEKGAEYPDIQKVSEPEFNEYNEYAKLLNSPIEFFKKIYELHLSLGFYLDDDELKYITAYIEKNCDNKPDCINIYEIFKRLNGYNTQILDKNNEFIKVGDKVYIDYDNIDNNIKNIKGKVKYDVLEEKFYINVYRKISGLSNEYGQIWLNSSMSNILDNEKCIYNEQSPFEKCMWYLKIKDYSQLFTNLVSLFTNNKLYLTPDEIKYIKQYLKKINEYEEKNIIQNNTDNKDTVVIQMLISYTYPDTMEKIKEMLIKIADLKDVKIAFAPPSYIPYIDNTYLMQNFTKDNREYFYNYNYRPPIIKQLDKISL